SRFKGFIEQRGSESGGWRGRLAPDGGPAEPAGGGPAGLADAPVRERPESRMTGEGAPPPPADPDDPRRG
ncbi:cyclase, partial [Kitasatospora indigofera]